MSLSNITNRLSGDYVRNFIVGAVLFAFGLGFVALYPTAPAAPIAVEARQIPMPEAEILIKGVDLLAMMSMNEQQKPLYELTSYDRVLYKRIFAAQNDHQWQQANALIKRLRNPVLVGHILYSRYSNDAYRASYRELRDWMLAYGDHPEAFKMYQLAQKRRNNDPASLPVPQITKKLFGSLELSWLDDKPAQNEASFKPLSRNETDVTNLMRNVRQDLSDGYVTEAYNRLGNTKTARMLSAVEYDALLSEIAAQYYYNGKYNAAMKLSDQAIRRSGKAVPIAYWIGGLAAWQGKNYAAAARHFEMVTQSQSHNPWLVSAGAFWAARAHQKLNHGNLANNWLREAANYPRTFYGIIAKAKLGRNDRFSWVPPVMTPQLVTTLQKVPSGRRALALLDIEQSNLAQQELMQTHPNGDQKLEEALIAVAHHFNLPELAMRLGNTVNQSDGTLYDFALYPVVPWKGDVSAGIEPALVNALIRQESQFDSNASNARSGAMGLMQLMPSTAQLVSDDSFDAKDIHEPEVNIALGQRYIRYLLKMPQVKGNLLYLAAAYNAGPGALARWQKKVDYNNDPFLFIESLPISETRGFIERVMTNYWIYNQRLEQEAVSLHALSRDQWPNYTLPDDTLKLAAAL